MGIFSRWTSTIHGATGRLDELDRDHVAKALRDVRAGSESLAQFLKERQLIPASDTFALERGRERVERSGLLRMMQETCAAINELGARTIVDAHTFLPPEPTLACFIFAEEGAEYLIRLELQEATPTLVFAERRWRDSVTNDFVRWAYRLAEIEPMSITVRLIHEIHDDHVSAEQVREWFFYLISGLDRSHAPSFRKPSS
jgi:hypothetical protein